MKELHAIRTIDRSIHSKKYTPPYRLGQAIGYLHCLKKTEKIFVEFVESVAGGDCYKTSKHSPPCEVCETCMARNIITQWEREK